MNADAFRHFYNYHFALNRFVWDAYVMPLTEEQFTRQAGYSHGSVRNQLVHLMSTDDAWFSGLRGLDDATLPELDQVGDRQVLRQLWDGVEETMRDYLRGLRDDMLTQRPFPQGEDENLILWQVLLHVVNHGTDHRAQVLQLLNDLGVKTVSQDYIFYVYDNP